jgi:hypothetical protein
MPVFALRGAFPPLFSSLSAPIQHLFPITRLTKPNKNGPLERQFPVYQVLVGCLQRNSATLLGGDPPIRVGAFYGER